MLAAASRVSGRASAVALPACFELIRNFCPDMDLSDLLAQSWDRRTIKIFGKEHEVPRLTRWYGERTYTYSGIENAAEPMSPWLEVLRRDVEAATGARFNSALLNYYRDGQDSVAWHSDDEKELGAEPTIASLSFGASRAFAIRARSGGTWRLNLQDGDLLVMRAESQRDYQHAVPKTTIPVGARVNVTFRWVD